MYMYNQVQMSLYATSVFEKIYVTKTMARRIIVFSMEKLHIMRYVSKTWFGEECHILLNSWCHELTCSKCKKMTSAIQNRRSNQIESFQSLSYHKCVSMKSHQLNHSYLSYLSFCNSFVCALNEGISIILLLNTLL